MVDRPVDRIQWTDAFKNTVNGQRFLLLDSRATEPDLPPIFIFASDSGLTLLREHADWAMDGNTGALYVQCIHTFTGTFDCVPQTVKKGQLFTLHAVINHSCLPGAFMILPNKEQATYERAFRALKASPILRDVQPQSVMSGTTLRCLFNSRRRIF